MLPIFISIVKLAKSIFLGVINIDGFTKALGHYIIHQVLQFIGKAALLMPIPMTDMEISVLRDMNTGVLDNII